jgi:neutral ceramidase
MPNTDDLLPYHSCAQIPQALSIFEALLDMPMEEPPVCASTRTTVSALRLGDWLLATAPGEATVLWAQRLRELSPVAPDKTIVLGYAQGHVGYLLTAEDWLLGGFEPTINLWGPLEGEYIVEQAAAVMALAVTPDREDAAAGGVDRLAAPVIVDDDLSPPDATPTAGTVPEAVPPELFTRSGVVPATAQPAATVARLDTARFVWIGEDPATGTPSVRLEQELDGAFVPVTRRSGRVVEDFDLLLTWTPTPLTDADAPRTHYWALEWQAVAWLGLGGDLAERASAPVGRYRFFVEGTGYTLASAPFEVTPGALAVTATPGGGALALTVASQVGEDGWRLLTDAGLSNRAIPLPASAGPITVTLQLASGGTQQVGDVAVADGLATVPVPPGETVTAATVTDQFGNVGTAAVP